MQKFKTVSRYVLGTAFILAGINHLIHPAFYARIMPPYLPWPAFLVALSGVCESVLGALLLIPACTRLAAWGLIALLIAVFPANLHMALHANAFPEFSPVALWGRLPFQPFLIGWAYWHTRPPAADSWSPMPPASRAE